MNATCQPLPRSAAEEMLQLVARSICDRPGESSAQRDSRTHQMVHATLGFEPRDGLEYMVSALVFGHFNLILDSMHDVFQGQLDLMKARTKTTIVALDRSMIALVKELREARKRPLAKWAEDAQRAEAAAAEAAQESPPAEAEAPAEAPPEPFETAPEIRRPAKTVSPPQAVTAAQPQRAHVVPLHTQNRTPVMPSLPNHAAWGQSPSGEADAGTMEQQIAAFQEALAAAEETLAEARALDCAKRETASGD
jgi:hypothetical protein